MPQKPPSWLDPRGELPPVERKFQPTVSVDEAWAVKDAYEKARRAGRTFAGTPHAWIAEWLLQAARVAAEGRPFQIPDERYEAALARVMASHPFSTPTEAIYQSVIACAAWIDHEVDPYNVVTPGEPPPTRGRRGR